MEINQNITPVLSEFKTSVQKLYGDRLVKLILFGSYSRGDENENSDIDVLVVLNSMLSPYAEITRMGDIKYDILEKYEKIISTIPTTLELYEEPGNPLYREIKREGIIL